MTQDNSQGTGLSAAQRARLLQHLRHKNQVKAQQQAIPRVDLSAPVPASFAQQRLWFLHQLAPDDPAYNWPASVRCTGPLQPARLQHSLTLLIARHAILRTTFAMIDNQLMQIIAPPHSENIGLSLPVVSLEQLTPDAQEAEVQRRVQEAARQPFDLSSGPLLRAQVLRLSPSEHVLVLFFHHIIADGWSAGILLRDTLTLYQALAAGDDPATALPALPIQYADYALWQRQMLQGESRARLLRYWQQQLGGVPMPEGHPPGTRPLPQLELPTDYPRPTQHSSDGRTAHFDISPATITALRQLVAAHDATLFMGLLALWGALLHRTTGQPDLLIGTPIAGRTRPEVAHLIGFFTNTLVLRLDLSGTPTFRELLTRVRQVCLGAYDHQELPLEQIVEALPVARRGTDNPLFQVFYALDNTPELRFETAELRLEPVAFTSTTVQFDLVLTFRETAAAVSGSLSYRADLFAPDTIARLIGHLRTLLDAAVADPDRSLAVAPMLTAAERQQILVQWNRSEAEYPHEAAIHQLIEEQAARTPHAIAVRHDKQTLTYAALNAQANQLARYLRAQGVSAETRVGIAIEPSVEAIVAMLAILKAGGAYVPLDPAYPAERLRRLFADSQIALVLTQDRLVERLPDTGVTAFCMDRDWSQVLSYPTTDLAVTISPDQLAYMIYTSGSTGMPKGVLLSHRGVINNLVWRQNTWPLAAADRVLLNYSLSFDPSVWSIFWPLSAGATLVLVRSEVRYDSAALVRVIAAQQITVLGASPSQHAVLLEDPGIAACTQLRYVVAGGEQLSGNLQQRFFSRLAATLCNCYGPTEATIDATFWICPREDAPQAAPIGRPLPNVQIYVLDQHMEPLPIGGAGELYIGGVGLARGYHNRPDLTAEKFIPNPFGTPGGRLYKTGDLARYRADGALEFLGRIDQQVKLRGYRIELGEIETALRQHPAVRDAAVIAREETGDMRLVAYVVENNEPRTENSDGAEDGSLFQEHGQSHRCSPQDLRAFLKDRLPEYMVPSAFVLLKALPLNPNGKLDRAALPAVEAESVQDREYVAPETALEVLLVRIWEAILQVHPIGVTDDFFERGGHSLLAVRLLAQIEKQLGQTLSLPIIFAQPTIRRLAAALSDFGWPGVLRQADHLPEIKTPLVAIQPEGSNPPFFLAAPLGGVLPSNILAGLLELMPYLGADQPYYGLQVPGVAQELHFYLDLNDPFNPAQIEKIAQQFKPDAEIIAASAARCIAAMGEVDPDGPYFIGGFCTGSILAFEIACQLQQQGKSVALLTLIDPPPVATDLQPRPIGEASPADASQLAAILDSFKHPDPAQVAWFIARDLANERLSEQSEAMDLEGMIAAFRRLDPEQWWEYGAAALKQAIKSDVDAQELRRLFMIAQINTLSLSYTLRSYIPPSYPDGIIIIQSEQLSDEAATRRMEWQQLSSQAIAHHQVPGDHSTLFLQPNIQVLVRRLRECIAEAVALQPSKNGKHQAETVGHTSNVQRPLPAQPHDRQVPPPTPELRNAFATNLTPLGMQQLPAHRQLPVVLQQDVHTYLFLALPLCVLLADQRLHSWYYEHYVNIFSRVSTTDRSDIIFAFVDKYVHQNNVLYELPLFNNFSLSQSSDIINFLKANINDEYRIIIQLDEYYLPHRPAYNKFHFSHECLVYGYDDDKQKFMAIGINRHAILDTIAIDYKQLALAYMHVFKIMPGHIQAITLVRPIAHASKGAYPFSIQRFARKLHSYLHPSEQPANRWSLDTQLEAKDWDYKFGHAIYDDLIAYYTLCSDIPANQADYRTIHIIYEHKKCLRDRIDYLNRQENNRYGDLLQRYMAIVERVNMYRLQFLKYMHGEHKHFMPHLVQIIQGVKEEELEILHRLYTRIMHQ
jgi:amino acid adenylation domain-containing protein